MGVEPTKIDDHVDNLASGPTVQSFKHERIQMETIVADCARMWMVDPEVDRRVEESVQYLQARAMPGRVDLPLLQKIAATLAVCRRLRVVLRGVAHLWI